jgi:hypothetical protein
MTTRWINRLRVLLFLWGIIFSGALGIFVFATDALFTQMNDLSMRYTPHLAPIAYSSERFWMVLTTSLMLTLVMLCFGAALDIKQRMNWVPLLLVSKFVSTISFLAYFLTGHTSLAYVIGALTDGFVFLLTVFVYTKANREDGFRGHGNWL